MATAATADVLKEILGWSSDRPPWQRDALRRLVTEGEISDEGITKLKDLCKSGSLSANLSGLPNGLYFGDGTGAENAQADVSNFQVFQSVPEPSSVGLLVAGGLMMLRRRRRDASVGAV